MSVYFRWIDINNNGNGYKVYRDTVSFDSSSLPAVYATLPQGSYEYTDSNVNYGDEFYYVVSLVDSAGGETFSETIHAIAKENIYVVTASNVIEKLSYEFEPQWKYHNYGDTYTIYDIDSNINSDVAITSSNKMEVLGDNGVRKLNYGYAPQYRTNIPKAIFDNDDTVLLMKMDGGNGTGYRRFELFNTNDYSTVFSSAPVFSYYTLYGMRNGNYLMVKTNGTIDIRSKTTLSVYWQNNSQADATAASFDSVGFVYTGHSNGKICKFNPDPNAVNYALGNAPLYEDTTTFITSISHIYTDRSGNPVVTSGSRIVKFDTSGNVLWDQDILSNILDFRIEYNGHIVLCTDDSRLMRLDATTGATILEETRADKVTKLTIDPGRTNITYGAIINF